MAIKHYVTLSTTEPNNEVGIIKVRQADEETQTLVVNITENGVPKSFEGYQPFFCAKFGQTPGLGIIEQPVTVATPTEGKLEYTFNSFDWQMLGKQIGYFVFRNAQGQQFSTRDFCFTVTKSVFSDGLTELKRDGSTYVWKFEDMLRLFEEYIATGKTDWEFFVEQNREVLESVDPGGTILLELINSRTNIDSVTYASLSARLNAGDTNVKAIKTEIEAARSPETSLKEKFDKTKSSIDAVSEDLERARIELKETADANSKGYLSLPVYNNENDFQATHPSALFFSSGFGGKKWWLAFTPYENSNEALENPSVVCSDDGLNWSVPNGGSNPLATTPNVDNMHYSDTHLVYVSGRLECWYRRSYRGANPLKEEILRRTTTDGVTWTAEEILYSRDGSVKDLLCPTVIFNNNNYCIWVVNAQNGVFEYFETPDGKNWSKVRDITFPVHQLNNALKPWHMDIKKNGNLYEMYYQVGVNDIGEKMCYATSTDNVNYTWIADVMENRPNNFDSYRIYRPSIVDINDTRYLFYGGSDLSGAWYIGVSTAFVDKPDKFFGASLKGSRFNQKRVGRFSHMSEGDKRSEVKLVVPGLSDVRIVNDSSRPNVIQFKEGLDGLEPYAKTLAYQYSFWDSTLNDAQKYIMVDNGQLVLFDGNYQQRIALVVSGGTSERPKNPLTGQMFFDLTLGKPMFWNSWAWVDAMGNQ